MPTVEVALYLGMDGLLEQFAQSVPDYLVTYYQDVFAEFEVLDMALHDEHYGRGRRGVIPATSAALPVPYEPAIQRAVSSDVIGNIGEGLGIATLCHTAEVGSDEVARIRRQRMRSPEIMKRTPDFAICMKLGRDAWSRLQRRQGNWGRTATDFATAASRFPARFPVESKSSIDRCAGRWSALWQLAEYWHNVAMFSESKDGLGCGVIVETSSVGVQDRSVAIRILAPRSPVAFAQKLTQLPESRSGMFDFLDHFGRQVFYGD